MVTLSVSKESKPLSGHDVSFLMDLGTECNVALGCVQGDRRSTLEFPQCTWQHGTKNWICSTFDLGQRRNQIC